MAEFIGIAFVVLVIYLILTERDDAHDHHGVSWDGYHETCKCGAGAGDKKDPKTGQRYTFFHQWPK